VFGLFLTLVAVLGAEGRAEAQQLEQVFQDANKAYFSGDFAGATRGFEQLGAAGVDDADVWFNLANAHGRLGHYGQAIVYYERAIRLRPSDDEAREGLSAVQDALGRRLAEELGEAMVETRPPFAESLVRPFTEDALAWMVLVFDLLFFGGLLAFPRVRAESGRLGLAIAIPLLGVLLALSSAGLSIKADAFGEGARAVVLGDVSLREGPDPRAGTRSAVNEGEHSRVVEEEGSWVHVRLSDGRRGWMMRSEVGYIAP